MSGMAENMTLAGALHLLRSSEPISGSARKAMADAIDAHLAQPVQAVDVGNLRHLIGKYWDLAYAEGKEGRCTDTRTAEAQRTWCAIEAITRAIGNAQAVDVGAIREVIAQLQCTDETGLDAEPCYQLGEKLTRAIGNAQAEGWKVPTGCVLVAIERGEGYEDVHPELVAEDCMGTATDRGWRYSVIPLPSPRAATRGNEDEAASSNQEKKSWTSKSFRKYPGSRAKSS